VSGGVGKWFLLWQSHSEDRTRAQIDGWRS
jgi:hypothetical protein